MAFYGSKAHAKKMQEHDQLVASLAEQRLYKRGVRQEAAYATVLNAINFVYLTSVLANPRVDRAEKEEVIANYLKITAGDIFSFEAGLIEHADPFNLVSGRYGSAVKGVLRAGEPR